MKIAILGATSQIAKDLIKIFLIKTEYDCTLFVRNPADISLWLEQQKQVNSYTVLEYEYFNVKEYYDVIINFVGAGDPVKIKEMGSAIFDITYQFDNMVLEYLKLNPFSKYIFLSSGAVYGNSFEQPVTKDTKASININDFESTGWYGVAKLYAEAKHRALSNLSIVDIRVFNYFSHTQNFSARFFLMDMIRAIEHDEMFITSDININRDFITAIDFFGLIDSVIHASNINTVFDCYTKSPVDKFTILKEMEKQCSLQYKVEEGSDIINSTGVKLNYYSINRAAEDIGYKPKNSSLSGIFEELNHLSLFKNKNIVFTDTNTEEA